MSGPHVSSMIGLARSGEFRKRARGGRIAAKSGVTDALKSSLNDGDVDGSLGVS